MYVLFNANSSEYLFKITNNYHEEGAAKFSVNVVLFIIRKCVCFWGILNDFYSKVNKYVMWNLIAMSNLFETGNIPNILRSSVN